MLPLAYYTQGDWTKIFFRKGLTDEAALKRVFLSNPEEYTEQIFEAFFFLLDNNVLHYDAKLENIVLDSSDKRFKFIDFGHVLAGPEIKKIERKKLIGYVLRSFIFLTSIFETFSNDDDALASQIKSIKEDLVERLQNRLARDKIKILRFSLGKVRKLVLDYFTAT